jgi:broad specificity phosphatase PhoE
VSAHGEIILVRHGRTASNAGGLLSGRVDVTLDGEGRAQATAVAAGLPTPDLVVSSPLSRARETAAAFGVEVEIDESWIELDYGEWDGRPVAEVTPATWAAWRADVDFRPPGGESIADLTARVHDALDTLSERVDGRRVVVVSHVSPIKAAVAWALGVGPEVAWRTFVAPASISRVGLGPTGPALRTFNERGHLAPAAPG